ncbi:hypothetical protein Tco_1361058 [Tanacetum coccineum]
MPVNKSQVHLINQKTDPTGLRCDTHQEKLLNSLHGQRYSFKWFKSNKDLNLNADALFNAKQENLRVWLLKMLISKKPVPNVNTKDGEYIKCAAENHT